LEKWIPINVRNAVIVLHAQDATVY